MKEDYEKRKNNSRRNKDKSKKYRPKNKKWETLGGIYGGVETSNTRKGLEAFLRDEA